MTFVE